MDDNSVFIWDGKSDIPNGAKNIVVKDGIKEIGMYAFDGCKSLESITIPYKVTRIGDQAFSYCTSLKSITIPNSVTRIGSCAFRDCDSLESVTIPDSVTEIGDRAFSYCTSLKSITIPEGVTKINMSTFFNCLNLESVTISDGVTEIGDYAFRDCASLKSITIPDSVTEIGDRAFENCDSLESVTISDGVTEIGDHAFGDCASLKSITIPDSVTEIDNRAFENCHSLESVTIPDSVTEIGDRAFENCDSLKSINYKNRNIKEFLDYDSYGVNSFAVASKLIRNNVTFDIGVFEKAVEAAHAGKLHLFVKNYPDFGSMNVSASMRAVPDGTKKVLKRLFSQQEKTGKRIPKCLNRLALASNATDTPVEDIVKNFDIDYTRNVLKEGKPFVPSIVNRCYYTKDVCNKLYDKDLDSIVAETISSFNSSKDIRYKNAADFIVGHMDTDIKLLQEVSSHAKDFDVNKDTTVNDIRKEIAHWEAMGEVYKINKEYGIDITKCTCNIPVTETVYNDRKSRILDFKNEDDISLGTRLGYLTNCCQHLGSAGETAMMHGFLNPDAGFFVIEGKDGSIKAQAEIWLADKDTLVFDNIEFANTDSDNYEKRVKELRGDIANFAMQSGYKDIIMGCGYNEFDYKKMEKAKPPKLRLTPHEIYVLQEDNDAEVEFKNVKEAIDYMKTKKYDPDDFVYSDVDGDHGSVYIKHNGKVSDYLMEGYNKKLSAERQTDNNRKIASAMTKGNNIFGFSDTETQYA